MGARPVQVSKPHLFPACCVNCGAVEISGRWFVDLGFEINHLYDAFPDGAVYMCEVCLREYVRIFMKIIEEQERILGDVTFGRPRTDPVFDGYREKLDSFQSGLDSATTSSEQDSPTLTASFGGR